MNLSILRFFKSKRKGTKAVDVSTDTESIVRAYGSKYDMNKCYASAYPMMCGGLIRYIEGNKKETCNLCGSLLVKTIIDSETDEILSVTFEGRTLTGSEITCGRLMTIEQALKDCRHAYSGESYFTLSDLGTLPNCIVKDDGEIKTQFSLLGLNTIEVRSKLDTDVIMSIRVNDKTLFGESITSEVINEVRSVLSRYTNGITRPSVRRGL